MGSFLLLLFLEISTDDEQILGFSSSFLKYQAIFLEKETISEKNVIHGKMYLLENIFCSAKYFWLSHQFLTHNSFLCFDLCQNEGVLMGSSRTQLSFHLLPALPHPNNFCAHGDFHLLLSHAWSSLSWGLGGLQKMQNLSQAIEIEDSWELGGLGHVPSVIRDMNHGTKFVQAWSTKQIIRRNTTYLCEVLHEAEVEKTHNRILAGVVFTGSVGAVCTQKPCIKLLGVY